MYRIQLVVTFVLQGVLEGALVHLEPVEAVGESYVVLNLCPPG